MRTAIPRKRGDTGGPDRDPVTLEELKANSNITITADDEFLATLIQAATDYTEQLTGRILVPRTVDFKCDSFPVWDEHPIVLPYPPLISITSVKYYDSADTLQTWGASNYEIDAAPVYGGLLYPVKGETWPATREFRDSVQIEYIAGYDPLSTTNNADRVPRPLRQAITMLASHLYENREATTVGNSFVIQEAPLAYLALIANYRVRQV